MLEKDGWDNLDQLCDFRDKKEISILRTVKQRKAYSICHVL